MSESRSRVTVPRLAGAALVLAVLRYFMKGWLDPLHVPVGVGSFLASVTVVMLIGLALLFSREGRAVGGRYVRAAAWFILLALWCEILVIAGVLISGQTGADTYYQGPWQTVKVTFPTAREHAIGHTQGFVFRAVIGLLLGAAVYALSARKRASAP